MCHGCDGCVKSYIGVDEWIYIYIVRVRPEDSDRSGTVIKKLYLSTKCIL